MGSSGFWMFFYLPFSRVLFLYQVVCFLGSPRLRSGSGDFARGAVASLGSANIFYNYMNNIVIHYFG